MNSRFKINISDDLYNDISNYLNAASFKEFDSINIYKRLNKDVILNLRMNKYIDDKNEEKYIKLILNINNSKDYIYSIKYIEDFYKTFRIEYKDSCYGVSFEPDINIDDYHYCKMMALNSNRKDIEYLRECISLNKWSLDEDLMESCYLLLSSDFIYETPEHNNFLINKCLYFGADESIEIEDCMNRECECIQTVKNNMVSILLKELKNINNHIKKERQLKNFARKMYSNYTNLMVTNHFAKI